MASGPFRLSGDEGVGLYEPADIQPSPQQRVPDSAIDHLRRVRGLVSTASDVLDEAGWRLSVPSSVLLQRHPSATNLVGHALTLRYLPSRRNVIAPGSDMQPPKLAHHVIFRMAQPGDVMVIDASAVEYVSTMGGIAATGAVAHGISGVVADGGVRDLDDIIASGLSVWSRYLTPRCGKRRIEAVSVNRPVIVGGVQVWAGDLVLADSTGICFVPAEFADELVDRVREIAESEASELA